jgi:hypothetical protein
MTFKVKDFANKRTKGARCDQSTKRDAVKTLNEILGQEKSKKTTKIMIISMLLIDYQVNKFFMSIKAFVGLIK